MHATIVEETQGGAGNGAALTGRGAGGEETRPTGGAEGGPLRSDAAESGGLHSDAASEDSPAGDDATGAGGGEEGEVDSETAGSEVSPGAPRATRVSDREIEIAIKAANGNVALAARSLGKDKGWTLKRINKLPHLAALYGAQMPGKEINLPNDVSTMVRTPGDIPPLIENTMRAEELMAQDRQMLRDGLAAAGIEPKTIERLKALDGLAKDAGTLLSASLDYTHRLHIYSQAALFEEMIYIRETYLRPGEDGKSKIDPMTQVFWQRAFNEIADLLGKGSDRTMASTQAMVAMMKAQTERKPGIKGAKGTPGF